MNATLAQLRNFLALADSGSFTRAAGQNQRSQAAFSRSIAVLESSLGVALVDRVGHRNVLTPIGRTVLEHARQVVAQTDEMLQVVRHHTSGDAGHLRLGLGATPSALLSRPLLQFAAQHRGGMRLTVSRGALEPLLEALRERRLDALVMDFRSAPRNSADLAVEKVGTFATGALCRPAHPLAGRETLSLDDLRGFPVASTEVSEVVARRWVERFGPQAHPGAVLSLRCEDIVSLLEVVQSSDAVYVGIVANAQALIQSGALVRLPFVTEGLESELAWVQRIGRAPNPMLDEVHALVRKVLAEFEAIYI